MLGDLVELAVTVSPFVAGWAAIKTVDRVAEKRHAKAIAPAVIDGRTQHEWFELIKSIGPKGTEELMLGPLDAQVGDNGEILLNRAIEHAWHPRQVMGQRLWKELERDWYPNEFCTFCDTRDCQGKCDAKLEHDHRMMLEKERQEIEAARRKQIESRKAKMIEERRRQERELFEKYSKAVRTPRPPKSARGQEVAAQLQEMVRKMQEADRKMQETRRRLEHEMKAYPSKDIWNGKYFGKDVEW